MGTMLEEALFYAQKGWYVFPCREKPGAPYIKNGQTIIPCEKSPYTFNGLNDATLDEDQIKKWWGAWNDALIGVNAGLSNLFVVDIDKKNVNGFDTYSKWDINDVAGLRTITPSGGMHIIFTGKGKTNTNATTGIDTRGEGGYFIAPPSKILEGAYCGEYKRSGDWSKSPGVIPNGLMEKLFPENSNAYSVPRIYSGKIEKKQLSKATLSFITNGAPEGMRNATLFKALADFAGCGYTKEESRETVGPVSDRIGLSRGEFEQVLDHAYSKERTPSIPEYLQEKIASGGKDVAKKITFEEQSIIEYAVLSCAVIDNQLIPVIADIIKYDDFQNLKNKYIFQAMLKLYLSGSKADFYTIPDEIAKSVAGNITLDDIVRMIDNYFVNTDNIVAYVNIIKERASIRKLEAILDNKEKYLGKENFVEMVSSVEKDIADVAVEGGAKSTSMLNSSQAVESVKKHMHLLETGQIQQLSTGFSRYDSVIGGLYSNELVICAGRAGEGKSALALSIINHNSIVKGNKSAIFSLEMSTYETVCRLVCQMTGIPFKKIYQGKMTDEQWRVCNQAMAQIDESNIYFDEGIGMSVRDIRSKIRKLADKGVGLIVIDQLEQIKGYEGMPAYVQFDKIAYDIKNLTLEFNIPIILNHQLNRNITNRALKNPEPQLADLNQAGEKPANQVWVISHNKDATGKILQSKIKILKNRNGPRLDFSVVFIEDRMLFSNPTTPEEEKVFYSGAEQVEEDDYVYEDMPSWAGDVKKI